MSEKHLSTGRAPNLSGWVSRLTRGKVENETSAIETANTDEEPASRESELRRLYAEVGDFLFSHGLSLTPVNFAVAHDYLTGRNMVIEQAVSARLRDRNPITDDWCEQLFAAIQVTQLTPEGLSEIIEKAETQLTSLAGVITESHQSTLEYQNALISHVDQFESHDSAEKVVLSLIDLTKAMAVRIQEFEGKIRQNQRQTASLRRSLEKARHSADNDHLTGLANRRSFERLMKAECSTAVKTNKALSIAFCDIDHFKKFNDNHGHETGDRVLKLVAELLAGIESGNCHAARHGGEEFVLLFEDLTAEEAKEALDECRINLASRRLVSRTTGQPLGQITFSAGVAKILDYDNPGSALKEADDALYAAKRSGRNQVLIAGG